MLAVGTLASLYQNHLEQFPERSILIQDGRALSYSAFDNQVSLTRSWLSAQGVKSGDRIAVWVVNRSEWLVLFFALAQLNATLVAVNTKYRSHELQYILSNSQASILVLQLNFRKIDFAQVIQGVDGKTLPYLEKIIMLDAQSDAPMQLLDKPVIAFDIPLVKTPPNTKITSKSVHANANPDALAAFFTTSGTTKGPKLVMHSQRTLTEHANDVAQGYNFAGPDNRLLCALPFCGVFGLNSALAAIAAGMPLVLMDFFDAASASSLIQSERVTHVFGSDEMLRRLIEHVDQQAIERSESCDIPFPSLSLFGFASFSPRFIELARVLTARGFPLRGLYGSSEVHALFSIQRPDLPLEDRALGGGMPAANPRARVRVKDPDTGQLCSPYTPGEIEIFSPTLFKGYFNNDEATCSAFTTDGYFKTGDLGYMRDDASFVYLSRMGDTMRLGGFLVDPTEIEHVLAEQPEVDSAQVVGIEINGQLRPVAFATPKSDQPAPDAEQICARLATTLAAFKVPAHLWFIDAFPATQSANGLKFQRVKLRDMALARLRSDDGNAGDLG
jgi:fatty-acyl-CoA synthase